MGGKFQSDKRNLSMVMDEYELTMANGYYKTLKDINQKAVFDVFFRKIPDNAGFAIAAGLEQILEYIDQFHFDQADLDYLKSLNKFDPYFLDYLDRAMFDVKVSGVVEGTVVYPNEPILTIEAPIILAQMLETELLVQINHQTLIATKANRVVRSADGRPVADFGARRAHNNDAAVFGARAAYIGGVPATATVMAGQYFGIPTTGTMAHSWVQSHDTELEAFMNFAKIYPNQCVLLIDTYDTLESGLPNAIKTFEYLRSTSDDDLTMPSGYGVRIDSGDLAYLSKEVRKALNFAGFPDAKIVVSNSLDEYTIRSLLKDQNAPIDAFGVGENLITSRSCPVFGAVYKLVGLYGGGDMFGEPVIVPKIKISDNPEKITNPGKKWLFRVYHPATKYAIADIISDKPNIDGDEVCIDPEKPWIRTIFDGMRIDLITRPLYEKTNAEVKSWYKPTLKSIQEYVKNQLAHEVYPEVLRFENPYIPPVYFTQSYYDMKIRMLEEAGK